MSGKIRNWLDYRFVLIGSLLPDIIDKPLGTLLFPDFFGSNRIIAHTLLFLIIAGLLAVLYYKRPHKALFLGLFFGTAIHFILDGIWLWPQTFFWPLYGWSFTRTDLSNWLPRIIYSMHTDPAVYIPEIIGTIVVVAFTIGLIRTGNIISFLKTGQI